MNKSRARSLRLVLWLALLALALRPASPPAALGARLVAPLAFLCELASPLDLLRRAHVRAAERRVAGELEASLEESADLLAALARAARPSEPALREGRRLVHGEVLGPTPESRDRLRVRLADLRGVRPGLPVASGDAYVGRVLAVPPGADASPRATVPGVVTVELVTAGDFHVGARVARAEGGVLMTVGGLDALARGRGRERAPELRLAVHHPSDREVGEGLARVHELFADAEPYAALADGFHLGQLAREADEGRVFLRPELDYQDGLYHVVVLAPPDEGLPLEVERDPSLLDASWLEAPALSVSDPSPWRESAKLRAGARDGVRPGAAVALGPRLVGRVARVGPTTCDVAFLGDPGFSVVAVALLAGEEAPRVLGRLVSLGRVAGTDRVRLRWLARSPLPESGAGARAARLFTGSGDSGLESGFFLGETLLPEGGGPRPEIELATGFLPRDAGTLHVRLDPFAAGAGGGAP